jgi:hypothetical protein
VSEDAVGWLTATRDWERPLRLFGLPTNHSAGAGPLDCHGEIRLAPGLAALSWFDTVDLELVTHQL